MSSANVDKAKVFYSTERIEVAELFRREDAVEFLESTFGDLFHPEFEVVSPESSVPPTGVGMRGFVEGWRDWLEPWQSWAVAAEDYIDLDDDRVVVLADVVARPKDVQADVPQSLAAVLTFRNGRIVRVEHYLDTRQALEDLGLEP